MRVLPVSCFGLAFGVLTISTAITKVEATPEPAGLSARSFPVDALRLDQIKAPASFAAMPIGRLLDPESATIGFQLPPAGGGQELDDPLNLGGEAPGEAEVREAISKAVEYVLTHQNENGSWDVALSGTMLSDTADQAVDAVAVTALAGLALRRHIDVDRERIEPALGRAADFIMNRIVRGKLSTRIYYAVWRYTWGLKFLTAEYLALDKKKDQDRMDQMAGVCRRMVNSLMQIQLIEGEKASLGKQRKAKIGGRHKEFARPSNAGLVLEPPTDTDFRGGAVVKEVLAGSAAATAGILEGDRVIKCEDLIVENALDYYSMETEFVGGQSIKITVLRDQKIKKNFTLKLAQVWPGFLGVEVTGAGGSDAGVMVSKFTKFSAAKRSGEVEVGDIITKVDKTDIVSVDDYYAATRGLVPGAKVRLKLLRGKKKPSATIICNPLPSGSFGFAADEEDKSDADGVVVGAMAQGAAAVTGLSTGDRIMGMDHVPVLGLDHWLALENTIPAGKETTLRVMRGSEMIELKATAAIATEPGDLQIDLDRTNATPTVKTVKAGSEAEKAKIRPGDVVSSVAGRAVKHILEYDQVAASVAAGDLVELKFLRGGAEYSVAIEASVPSDDAPVYEVGGWAYYPDMGVATSFTTAATLMALIDVKKEMKIRVPKGCTEAAANLIESMRVVDSENGNVETYIYRAGTGSDVRGHIGRITACELALVMAGRRNNSQLKNALTTWQRYRGELDIVRRYSHTHHPQHYQNAAYYWMYGHYHTMMAANFIGGKQKKDLNDIVLKALLRTHRNAEEGTWLDHPSFGPLCGTCLALMVFGELSGDFRGLPKASKKPAGKTPGKTS